MIAINTQTPLVWKYVVWTVNAASAARKDWSKSCILSNRYCRFSVRLRVPRITLLQAGFIRKNNYFRLHRQQNISPDATPRHLRHLNSTPSARPWRFRLLVSAPRWLKPPPPVKILATSLTPPRHPSTKRKIVTDAGYCCISSLSSSIAHFLFHSQLIQAYFFHEPFPFPTIHPFSSLMTDSTASRCFRYFRDFFRTFRFSVAFRYFLCLR